MKVHILIIVGAMIMGLFRCSAQGKEENFWSWFQKNSDKILAAKNKNEPVIDELYSELKKVHPDLVYELSAVKDGVKTEFTISADGKPSLIKNVKELYDKRPEMENWDFKAFRQRMNIIFNFEMNDIEIKGDGTKYLLVKDNDPQKISLLLFFSNFSEDKRSEFGNAAYIYMDSILGEYDVMTKIGFIEVFGNDSKYYIDSHPIDELTKEFDRYFQ